MIGSEMPAEIPTSQGEFELVPDCGGLVRRMALAVPAAFFDLPSSDGACRPLVPIGNLIVALPADISVFLLVDEQALSLAATWLAALDHVCSVTCVGVSDVFGAVPGPWIQDMFHVRFRSGDEAPVIAAPPDIQLLAQPGDRIGPCLAAFLGVPAIDFPHALPGGNQLVGTGFRLLGQSELMQSRAPASGAATGPVSRWPQLAALDRRPISVFGYRKSDLLNAVHLPSPSDIPRPGFTEPHLANAIDTLRQYGFHVDQLVSLTGMLREGRPLVLVADPQLVGGELSLLVDNARRLLKASVSLLLEQGFEVIRNPVPFVVTPDSNKRLPRLYNNVMIENAVRPDRHRPLAWIPQFGDFEPLAHYDLINFDIWDKLGFDVIPVAGWSHLASRNGALRCASKVLERLEN